jgi:hypothetical protein
MSDRVPEGAVRRSIPWWAKITISVVVIGAIVLGVGIVRGSRNAARSAADWIPAYADSTGSIAYCANGYGKGIDNEVPWWEWTVLAKGSPSSYAEELSAALAANGFEVAVSAGSPVEYGEYSTLNDPQYLESIGWATSWVRLEGSNATGISVLARVADANTRNNCFPEGGDVVTEADLSEADVVAVILFRDRGN